MAGLSVASLESGTYVAEKQPVALECTHFYPLSILVTGLARGRISNSDLQHILLVGALRHHWL